MPDVQEIVYAWMKHLVVVFPGPAHHRASTSPSPASSASRRSSTRPRFTCARTVKEIFLVSNVDEHGR